MSHPTITMATAALGKDYLLPASRLIRQFKNLQISEDIHCLTDFNLNNYIGADRLKILNKKNLDIKKFFYWKPWYILSLLEAVKEGSIVFYLDAGTEISKRAKDELVRLLSLTSTKGSKYFSNRLKIGDWCEPSVMKILQSRFGHYQDRESVVAGALLLRNDSVTRRIVRQWAANTLFKEGLLFHGNGDNRHRHDQTVLSFILANEAVSLYAYPVWFDNYSYSLKTIYSYPIHTLRNKSSIDYLDFRYLILPRFKKIPLISRICLSAQKRFTEKWTKFRVLQCIEPECHGTRIFRFPEMQSSFKTPGDRRASDTVRYVEIGPIENCFIFKNGDIYIKGLAWLLSYRRLYCNNDLHPSFINLLGLGGWGRSIQVVGLAQHCLNEASGNIYHFFYDCLPRIMTLKNSLLIFGPGLEGLKIHLSNKLKSRSIFLSKRSPLFCRTLIVPPLKNYSGSNSELEIKFLNDLFEDDACASHKRRIIVNRETRDGRVLRLDSGQRSLIIAAGFEEVTLSCLPVQEQLKTFSQAECIIAPHGAALSWLFACRSGTLVFEVFSQAYRNDCYRKIAYLRNLHYLRIVGDTVPSKARASDPDICITDEQIHEILSRVNVMT